MLGTITPLGERARGNRYGVTATSYLLGTAIGGLALGLAAASVAALVRLLHMPVIVSSVGLSGLLIVAASLLDSLGFTSGLPPRRQVNERWPNELRGWAYGFLFGVQLGFGVSTIVYSLVFYVGIIVVVLSGSIRLAIAFGIVFGTVRGVSVYASGGIRDQSSLMRIGKLQAKLRTPWRVATATVTLLIGVGLVIAPHV